MKINDSATLMDIKLPVHLNIIKAIFGIMIKILTAGILVSSILFIKCSNDTEADGDRIYECKTLPYSADTSARATSKTLKGHILFSWKNNKNGWNYSIVPNLNITPAQDNVSISNTFTGEECLKNTLNYFAEGEEFFWSGQGSFETKDGKKITLSYPPDDIVGDLKEFCDQVKIELIIEYQ
jgi:hypothetical protein